MFSPKNPFLGCASYFQITDLAGLHRDLQIESIFRNISTLCTRCSACSSVWENESNSLPEISPLLLSNDANTGMQTNSHNADIIPTTGVVRQEDQLHPLPGCDVHGGLHPGTG